VASKLTPDRTGFAALRPVRRAGTAKGLGDAPPAW
jgi:hypothetical protein